MLKFNGKYRKSKAYGLIGCLMVGGLILAAPSITYAEEATGFNRTDTGVVNSDNGNSSISKLTPSDDVKNAPNGEKNFNASVAITTEAGLGSGALVSEDTIVTAAHNFVHMDETTNPISVKENVSKNSDVHLATLPNGEQIRFSNEDVHYWNKDGFVEGYKNDLAVVKLKKSFSNSTPSELTEQPEEPQKGDKVSIYGYPKGKLKPVLNTPVETSEDYGANIKGVAYQGSEPGASGGGLYNEGGKLIGINQNGVSGLRSGGIAFSKEQLDWIKSYIENAPIKPVYLDKNSKEERTIEFTNERIKVTKQNEKYELSRAPWSIVAEDEGMKIEEEPRLTSEISKLKDETSIQKIRELEKVKTGYVFKVRSYESNGVESFRYFRTWTVNDSQFTTLLPFASSARAYISDVVKSKVNYESDNGLEYGKFKALAGIAFEDVDNVGLVRWALEEPSSPDEKDFYNTYPLLEDVSNKGTVHYDFAGEPSKGDEFDKAYYLNYAIGTKPVITKEILEYRKTKYVANKELTEDSRVLEEGSDKVKTTVTTYKLNKTTGNYKEIESFNGSDNDTLNSSDYPLIPSVDNNGVSKLVKESITDLKTKIIEKKVPDNKVVVTNIPSPVRYEKDETREKGAENVEIKGSNGTKTVTTTYDVEVDTGKIIEKVEEPVIVNPTETVIKVAAKDKVVVKELPSRVRYVGDENKENSTDPVRTEGKKGKEVTTTTYAVDPKTGTISESTKTGRTEEPTDTVVTIGTKPKVELIKDGGRTIERTTRYKVNEDTGEVVTTTTDKLLSSNGEGVFPPVVEALEFNGGVNGDLDGNALINEAPEFNGGVNGDLDGNAAIHDVPEYTGPLAGNGLTGEGEMVEPPVVDVPEFDLSKLPKEVKKEPKQEIPNVGTGLNSFNDGRKKPGQATEIVPVGTIKEEPKAETPKDVSTPVALKQKDDQDKQAPVQSTSNNKEMKELPNTGTASNAALTLAGVTFAMFGTVMLAKKKD